MPWESRPLTPQGTLVTPDELKRRRAAAAKRLDAQPKTYAGWCEWVERELPDLVESWSYGVNVLAAFAQHTAAGGWEVAPADVRRFYERHWRGHVEAGE